MRGEDKEIEAPQPGCDRSLPPGKPDPAVGSELGDELLQGGAFLPVAENQEPGAGGFGAEGSGRTDGRRMVLGGVELGERSDEETVRIKAERQTFGTAIGGGMEHRGIGGIGKSGDLRGIKADPCDEVEAGLFGKGGHMIGHPEDLPEQESLPARQFVERLVLVHHEGNARELRRQSREELVVVGLGMDDPDAVIAEPTRQLPDPEGVDPLRRIDPQELDGEAVAARLLTQHAKLPQADEAGVDPLGEMAVQGEEKILGPADRHGDERVGDPDRTVLPGSLYHWKPKRMMPFGFSGLSGSQVTLS